jgi:hypothetical protein
VPVSHIFRNVPGIFDLAAVFLAGNDAGAEWVLKVVGIRALWVGVVMKKWFSLY